MLETMTVMLDTVAGKSHFKPGLMTNVAEMSEVMDGKSEFTVENLGSSAVMLEFTAGMSAEMQNSAGMSIFMDSMLDVVAVMSTLEAEMSEQEAAKIVFVAEMLDSVGEGASVAMPSGMRKHMPASS